MDPDAIRAALACDREGGGVDAALGRVLDRALAAVGADSGGIDGIGLDGGLVAVVRRGSASDEPPTGAADALTHEQNGRLEADAGGPVVVPAIWDGRSRGVVWATSAGALADVDVPLVHALATRAGALLEHRRVLAQLEQAVVSGVAAEERMLGRIGLDIHDGPTQQMSVALLEVQLLQAEIDDARAAGTPLPDALGPSLERIYETLGGALHELRELIGTLRPVQFQARSLEDVVREAVAGFEARTGVDVSVETIGDTTAEGITLTQRITFFRILQEALANAHRHGRAQRASVRLVAGEGETMLEVADDGRGFDPAAIEGGPEGLPVQIGLSGMRDRAQLVGGTWSIDSTPGVGTTVKVNIPRWHAVGPSS